MSTPGTEPPDERGETPPELAAGTGEAVIRADGTWTDPAPPQDDKKLLSEREVDLEQQRHVNALQKSLLTGIGLLIIFLIMVLVGGLGFHWTSEDFAKTLAQMTIPALLTFGGTIVGTLFTGSDKKK